MPETMFDLGVVRVERVTRIELALSAWEADVLPLNYTRDWPKSCSEREYHPTDATCPTSYRITPVASAQRENADSNPASHRRR